MIRPEGIYACEGCGKTYPEYINGCVVCWDDDLTVEQNRAKYPNRRVACVVPELADREDDPHTCWNDGETTCGCPSMRYDQ